MTLPANTQAVIFDMDGLLIDSEPYWDEALIEMFHRRKKKPSKDALKAVLGMGMRESSQLLIDKFGLEGEVDALVAEKKKLFYELFLQKPELLPGAEDLIKHFHQQKIPMAIATMGHYKDKLEYILSILHLSEFFKELVTSEDVSRGKPHPDVYLFAANKLGIDPARCLVVEDAPNGIESGKAAGMTVYGINKNKNVAERLRKAGADMVYSSLEELL